jgi:hypothetical protein
MKRDEQFEKIEDVKLYLKEILDDDESGEFKYCLVSQNIYDEMRILLVRLLVQEFRKNQ